MKKYDSEGITDFIWHVSALKPFIICIVYTVSTLCAVHVHTFVFGVHTFVFGVHTLCCWCPDLVLLESKLYYWCPHSVLLISTLCVDLSHVLLFSICHELFSLLIGHIYHQKPPQTIVYPTLFLKTMFLITFCCQNIWLLRSITDPVGRDAKHWRSDNKNRNETMKSS